MPDPTTARELSRPLKRRYLDCGCETGGDNVAAFCPLHSTPLAPCYRAYLLVNLRGTCLVECHYAGGDWLLHRAPAPLHVFQGQRLSQVAQRFGLRCQWLQQYRYYV
jgi:hypothetical protein